MNRAEKIMAGLELFNAAMPGIAKIVVTLQGGKEIELQDLVQKTKEIVEERLKEAADHLAKGEAG